jgi:N-acetylglucosamine kinase-like BadF-type ATPase
MGLFLGIDIGGSAARWVAIDGAGAIVGRGSAPGATGLLRMPGARERLAASAGTVAAAAPRPLAAVRAGITGLDPGMAAEIRQILASALGIDAGIITLGDDMELAFLSAFSPGAGHLVAAGTGSIGLHIAADGKVTRVGGRGMLIDDGGSAAWIALAALRRLFRRIDERGSAAGAERLEEAMAQGMGGASWDEVRAFVYGADRGRIGLLAQHVGQAAVDGDPVAQEVLAEATRELARLARVLIGRAGALPVGFVGGVLDLSPAIRPGLVAALAGVDVRFPEVDAALTAARLARDPVPAGAATMGTK